jgi:hypothetical protein
MEVSIYGYFTRKTLRGRKPCYPPVPCRRLAVRYTAINLLVIYPTLYRRVLTRLNWPNKPDLIKNWPAALRALSPW